MNLVNDAYGPCAGLRSRRGVKDDRLQAVRAAIEANGAAGSALRGVSSNPLDGKMVSIEPRHHNHSLFLCQQAILGQPFFRYKRVFGDIGAGRSGQDRGMAFIR